MPRYSSPKTYRAPPNNWWTHPTGAPPVSLGNLARMRNGFEDELADRLALELSILDDCKISGMDVLGALAATGLKLVVDDDDEASVAYDEDQIPPTA